MRRRLIYLVFVQYSDRFRYVATEMPQTAEEVPQNRLGILLHCFWVAPVWLAVSKVLAVDVGS